MVRNLGSLVCRNLVAHDADAKTKTTRDSMNVGSLSTAFLQDSDSASSIGNSHSYEFHVL